VTNTIVSVGHIGRPLEYRRAFAAATVHDFFNVIAVAVFLTLELLFHPLEKMARMLGDFFAGMGGLKLASPIKLATKPLINALANSVGDHVWILLVVAFILMFGALTLLIKVLRGLVLSRIEGMFSRTVFKTALRAMALGLVVTVAVQSSSIATSVIIPLAAAGVLTLEQVFPYTLGSNVGTTVTAILASLATGELAAVVVALVHLLFNIFGIVLIWPIRRIPLMLATRLAQLTLRSRLVPILYIVVVFFLVPLLIYLMMT
jgi:sodium-dependent phosphate cotransporter